MPFLNGRFYMNPIFGAAIELARKRLGWKELPSAPLEKPHEPDILPVAAPPRRLQSQTQPQGQPGEKNPPENQPRPNQELTPKSKQAIKEAAKRTHQNPILLEYMFVHSARQNDLDPNVLVGLARREGSMNPKAQPTTDRHNVTHYGMFQMSPDEINAVGISEEAVKQGHLRSNIDAGARALRGRLDQFGGDERLALASYTLGPNSKLLPKGYDVASRAYLDANHKTRGTVGGYVDDILSYTDRP